MNGDVVDHDVRGASRPRHAGIGVPDAVAVEVFERFADVAGAVAVEVAERLGAAEIARIAVRRELQEERRDVAVFVLEARPVLGPEADVPARVERPRAHVFGHQAADDFGARPALACRAGEPVARRRAPPGLERGGAAPQQPGFDDARRQDQDDRTDDRELDRAHAPAIPPKVEPTASHARYSLEPAAGAMAPRPRAAR